MTIRALLVRMTLKCLTQSIQSSNTGVKISIGHQKNPKYLIFLSGFSPNLLGCHILTRLYLLLPKLIQTHLLSSGIDYATFQSPIILQTKLSSFYNKSHQVLDNDFYGI